jgi:hypothetical protein
MLVVQRECMAVMRSKTATRDVGQHHLTNVRMKWVKAYQEDCLTGVHLFFDAQTLHPTSQTKRES